MIRNLLGIIALFLLPTIAYLGYALLARPTRPARAVVVEAPLVWLAISGFVLVLATLTYYSSLSGGSGVEETYTPARIKDGQIVPGHAR